MMWRSGRRGICASSSTPVDQSVHLWSIGRPPHVASPSCSCSLPTGEPSCRSNHIDSSVSPTTPSHHGHHTHCIIMLKAHNPTRACIYFWPETFPRSYPSAVAQKPSPSSSHPKDGSHVILLDFSSSSSSVSFQNAVGPAGPWRS